MPFASLIIMLWQYRNSSPQTAAMKTRAPLPNQTASSASGKKTPATHASRLIHDRCGCRSTIDGAQRTTDLEDQQKQSECDQSERDQRGHGKRFAAAAGNGRNGEQSGPGAAAEKIAGCLPVPVRLVPGLDAAAADFSRLFVYSCRRCARRGRIGIAGLGVEIKEARLGAELAVHAKMLSARATAARRCCSDRRYRRSAARRQCRN